MDYIKSGKIVLEKEIQSLLKLKSSLDNSFIQSCKLINQTSGKTIFVGLGKSGHIAEKCSATFSSLGIPSFYVHASEAFHGDFGMMSGNDLIMAFSFSGKTPEIINVVKYCSQNNITVIGISGDSQSPLANASNVHLDICVTEEADHLGLAPTSSTTNMIALGDALASSVSEEKGFNRSDFHGFHPGGSLGNQLENE